jgi:hypothetical protein
VTLVILQDDASNNATLADDRLQLHCRHIVPCSTLLLRFDSGCSMCIIASEHPLIAGMDFFSYALASGQHTTSVTDVWSSDCWRRSQ